MAAISSDEVKIGYRGLYVWLVAKVRGLALIS
jgi:hypothetical protein